LTPASRFGFLRYDGLELNYSLEERARALHFLTDMRICFLNALIIAFLFMPLAASANAVRCADLFSDGDEFSDFDAFQGASEYLHGMRELLAPRGKEPLSEVISQPLPLAQPVDSPFPNANPAWTLPLDFEQSRAIQQRTFLENLMNNYGGTFSQAARDDILRADRSLEPANTVYAEVRTRASTIATWRWFEANALINGETRRKELPYVRMNRHQNVGALEVTRKLENFMDLGFGVTEIGNFSVRSDDFTIRERATRLIEMTWLRMARNDVIYVCHVLSPAHERLYRKYGFEIAEAYDVPGKKHQDAILWVRGWQFRTALKKHLQIDYPLGLPSRVKPTQLLLPAEFRN
jgi:hypothetical protein